MTDTVARQMTDALLAEFGMPAGLVHTIRLTGSFVEFDLFVPDENGRKLVNEDGWLAEATVCFERAAGSMRRDEKETQTIEPVRLKA